MDPFTDMVNPGSTLWFHTLNQDRHKGKTQIRIPESSVPVVNLIFPLHYRGDDFSPSILLYRENASNHGGKLNYF